MSDEGREPECGSQSPAVRDGYRWVCELNDGHEGPCTARPTGAEITWTRPPAVLRLGESAPAAPSGRSEDRCATCGHPLSTHDSGPSEDGCRFVFGWGDECACGWPVKAESSAAASRVEPPSHEETKT